MLVLEFIFSGAAPYLSGKIDPAPSKNGPYAYVLSVLWTQGAIQVMYYYYYFRPRYSIPRGQGIKTTLSNTRKVQKSSWNEVYSFFSFTKQSCSKMALNRWIRTESRRKKQSVIWFYTLVSEQSLALLHVLRVVSRLSACLTEANWWRLIAEWNRLEAERTEGNQYTSAIYPKVRNIGGIFPLTSPQPKYRGDVSPASGLTPVSDPY